MAQVPADFRRGMRETLPLLVGVFPFGLVVGVASVRLGMTPVQAVVMSSVAFAGASQLAAVELLANDANAVVVVVTATVVNVRVVMFSASIAPYFESLRTRSKAFLSFFLADLIYARSIAAFTESDAVDHFWYYLGVGSLIWVVWTAATIIGVVLGAGAPTGLHLEFAVPLIFLALLVSGVEDRPTAAAGVVAAAVAVVGQNAPYNLGLPLAALLGILVGLGLEEMGVETADREEGEV